MLRQGFGMRKIRLDFSDFWPGFRKDDNFLWHLLKSRFDVELHAQPDYLIYSNRETHVHRVHNCVKIYLAVESFRPNWNECDYAFTCHYLDDPRHMRFPWYVWDWYGPPDNLIKAGENAEQILAAKTKFCCMIVSNAKSRKTQKRIEFFKKLCQYKQVDSGGKALNNIGRLVPNYFRGKREFLRDYKFNLAFENKSLPGYTTEKIYEAMQARTMPIYWGNPLIHQEFNPRSFVNGMDFASDEEFIERIIELDRDDAKYLAALREPYYHGDQPNEFLSRERLLKQFERIFSEQITPVSQRRTWLRPGRWLLALRNKPRPADLEDTDFQTTPEDKKKVDYRRPIQK